MISGARIVVTGGLGAIGSALCRALLQREIASLTIIDDLSSSAIDTSSDVLADPRTVLLHDSILNEECLRRAFVDRPQDVVFHLAAHFANQNSVENPIADCEVNSVGTTKILEYARKASVKKFVFSSSSCVYGNTENFAVDTKDFHLDTPYAVNKLHGELLVNFYHEYYGMNTTIVRYFNSFGPGELPGQYRNVVPNFFALAMQGLPLPITGDPQATRDFNYVDNAVQATMLAATESVANGNTYNVGSGEELSIGDLAEKINRITSNAAGIEMKEQRSWDSVKRRRADISLTVQDLGYAPIIDIDTQLEQTYAWLQQHRSLFLPS